MENIDIEKQYEDAVFKMLKRFAFISRQFCDKYCVPDGLMDIMKEKVYTNNISKDLLYSNKLSYDYDYYAFTKSTKTLHAILNLLKDKKYFFNEDIMMLIRSIFENHILSRYFREHIDIKVEREKVINEFIQNPLGVSIGFYIKEGFSVKTLNGEILGNVKMPSSYKMGSEKDYYPEFYSYLCEFAHCSFGRIECYFDGANFYYDKSNLRLEAMIFTLFVFTKIFEGVVTVEGENFDTKEEENRCYNLIYDSLELQSEIFDFLIKKYETINFNKDTAIISLYLNEKNTSNRNSIIKSMLLKMKKSLDDNEIGSVIKEKNESGKYIRQYPGNW